MKKAVRTLRAASVVIAAIAMAVTVMVSGVQAKLDHKGMVDEIGGMFNEALSLYKKGNAQEAKLKTQAAYLEVYENLEGPIRINVSARKGYEMEQEFLAIRKMIETKEPAEAVEKKINTFMADLRSVTAKLEGGFELVAESSVDAKPQVAGEQPQRTGDEKSAPTNIEPVWRQCFENIQSRLARALDTYRKGDAKGAADQVIQAQFDEYKNSLLETAVRRHVSQKKDYENNAGFAEVAGMMQNGGKPEKVEARIAALVKGVEKDLPGLPVIDGAVSPREAGKLADNDAAEKDWKKVNSDLFAEIDKAIALYEKGERKEASILVQGAYFDVFEASGMEAKIGARDANFKGRLEGHFSKIAGQMKNGAPVEEIQGTFAMLKRDFEKGADMLGKGKDSPMTLFFYSLMIILREGIEAILIITAIIAYLVKTGNREKIKVIYNGCIAAIGLSLVTALLVKWVFEISAARQEAMEGWTMLLASVVLFSVSYWLISKAEAQKWVSYIKGRVGDSVSSNSLKALWFTAFLAIYREGAETVLFYQALAADSSSASGLTAVAGGFVLGSVLLVGFFLAMRYGAVKLPIRPFFLCTGTLLYYMAFVFAGKGMMELIAGKLFEPSLISWVPTVDFIGVYPYLQTLIPQLFIVLAAAVGLAVMARRRGAAAKG
ncbi:FTR1 family protein [Geobacter sp.]|uniref:FTR1 family iron permease n=1 Tax=Geobacter sp. TaxID=46610 RepID=UPI002612A67C|nr:FTR1 family protein [Geobacter sp.]